MNKTLIIGIAAFATLLYFGQGPASMSAREIDANCDIVLFSTQSCPYCRKARNYFKQQQLPFCERDIQQSTRDHELFKRLGGRGVPLVVIGDETIKGYSVQNFQDAVESQHLK